ncbi:hypothetical protein B0H10DRAFT_2203345 [Mycena sp. CBHHK59/15]|nr:hypothetical protein B0H10DRAFT_2203345 [Mycena sp. CBHHK59/15]
MSAPSTPPRNPLQDIFGAMDQDSPVAPLLTTAQKRPHSDVDEAQSDTTAAADPAPNPNTVSAIQRYTEKKRLRVEQATEVSLLLHDAPAIRHAKLLANIFYVSNQIGSIVTAAPAYEVSPGLAKNIHNYAAAILLSSKIGAYKGSIPTNTLLNILKKHRFDLPPGIENNPADLAKLVAATQEAFTQLRAKFKKALLASLKANKNDKDIAPDAQHQNIFKLTLSFVDGTQCTVTVELCARVALMRQIFLQDSGPKYWDKLDASLAAIRAQAKGNAKKITKYVFLFVFPSILSEFIARAFHHILTTDQETHGVKDYDLDQNVDAFQQEVDDLIDAGAKDVATSVATDDADAQPQVAEA